MTSGARVRKAIRIGLLTCGVMALATYALHWSIRYLSAAWGIEFGPLPFYIFFSLVAALVIWACAGKFLEELKRDVENKDG